jgi:DNA-binding SARP family transcriptional activator
VPIAVAQPRGTVRLELLEAFELWVADERVAVARAGRRLLAYLAFADRGVNRRMLAATLWPDTDETHSAGNLRSALWRLQRLHPDLVATAGERVALSAEVAVDVRDLRDRATWLLQSAPDGPAEDDIARLSRDVLPDWWDDWLTPQRERVRQLRLHALEALAARLADQQRFAEALDAGLAALASDSLRESAHRAVIAVHLAEGNIGEALRQFERCRRELVAELGCDPSPELHLMVFSPGPASHEGLRRVPAQSA